MKLDWKQLRDRIGPERDWYRIANRDDGTAEVVIYDEIGWFGVSAERLIDELRGITSSEITLRLSSPGGSVFDGIAIMNALRSHPARVTVHVDALAASIASVIAMAGDRIVMEPYSQLMIHDALMVTAGNAADLRELADFLDRQSDNIAAIYAERAGGTAAEWRERMRAESWYFADEAVAAGLADEAVPARRRENQDEDEVALAARWDLSVFNYQGRENAPAPAAKATVEAAEDQAPAPGASTPPVEAQTPPPPHVVEQEPEPASAPSVPEPVAVEPAPVPEPEPDPWATAIAHLITPPSTEDVWARLREALL